jgi:hypothetical protein
VAIGMLVRSVVKRQPLELPPLTAWVIAWLAVVLVQLLNPDNWSTLHSVASLRQHLEFVPLFFIAYSIMRTKRRLRVFMVLLLLVAAVNGAVSLIQFNMSPDQLASWGPGYADLIDGGSAAPRTAVDDEGNERTRLVDHGIQLFDRALSLDDMPGQRLMAGEDTPSLLTRSIRREDGGSLRWSV